ncbi:glutaredoxin family protein [Oceanobacillus indicireducens]|uniref:Glutaredoxin domain-containing protein n=1 Tax=Oceanobacillus indicireducens TaxID=1004261 RepID=A0A917Y227_9BACI|nr:glutaredoxin family protein [Oceanobacillus indicireducens]GGN63600.1 hypothetical protein GCM10007971_30660 [Oceanobacillus indicireducens]
MNQTTIVYTSALCPVCGMVKSFLDTLEIPYQEVNVDMNPVAMLQLITKTRRLSVPQTKINGKLISGFNPEKMMQALNGSLL